MPPAQALTSLQTVLAGLAAGSSTGRIIGTKHSPGGIETIIEYRSKTPVYLNVVDWVDTWMVVTISGLDSADLRASSVPNPGEHGETPNDALWGGRTVVLVGKQYAHTIWKLRDMQLGLRGAFLDVRNEYPLIFHAADPADDLMIMCRLADKINIPDQQTTRNEYQRDFQIPLRASNPRFLSVVRQQALMTTLSSLVTFSTDNVPVVEDFSLPTGLSSGYSEKGRGYSPGTSQLMPRDLLRNMVINPRGDTAQTPTTGVAGRYDWDISSIPGVGNVAVGANGGIDVPNAGTTGPRFIVTVATGHKEADIEFASDPKLGNLAPPVVAGDKLRITAWIRADATCPAEAAVGIGVRWWVYPQVAGPTQVAAPVPWTDGGFVAKPAGSNWNQGSWWRVDGTITVPPQQGAVAFPSAVIYVANPAGANMTGYTFSIAEPMMDIDRDSTRGVLYGDGTFTGWIYESTAKLSIARRRMGYANLLRNTRAQISAPGAAGMTSGFGGALSRYQEADPNKINKLVGHDVWWRLTSDGVGAGGGPWTVPPADAARKPMMLISEAVRCAEKADYNFSFYTRAATVPRRIYVRVNFNCPTGNTVIAPVALIPAQTHGSDGMDAVGEWRRFWVDIPVPAGAISFTPVVWVTTDDGNAIPNNEVHEISALMLRMGKGPRSYIDGSGTVASRLTPEYTWAGTAYDSPTLGPWGTRNLLQDSDCNKPDTSAYGSVASTLAKIAVGGAVTGGPFVRATFDPTQASYVMGLSSNAVISERIPYTISALVRLPPGIAGQRSVVFDIWWYQDIVAGNTRVDTFTSQEFMISSAWSEIKLTGVIPPDKASIAMVRILLPESSSGDRLDVDRMMMTDLTQDWFGVATEFAKPSDVASPYGESLRYNYSTYQTPRGFLECQQTAKLLLPAVNPGVDDMLHLALAYIDDDNQIYVTMENPNLLAIVRRDQGVTTSVANVALNTQVDGSPYYARARMSDGVVFAEAGLYDPDVPSSGAGWALPQQAKYTLTAVEKAKYQDVLLPMRLGVQSVGGNWTVDEWRYYDMAEPQGWNVYRGQGTINVKGSKLVPLDKTEKLMTRSGFAYKIADAKISVKCRYDTTPTQAETPVNMGVAAKVIDKDNFIAATLGGDATATSGLIPVNLYKYVNGVRSPLLYSEIGSFPVATDNWVRLIMVGNDITVERWTTDPILGGAPADFFTWTLAGADIAKFGAGVKGEFGIYWPKPSVLVSSMDDFRFDLANFDDIAYTVLNRGNFEAQTTIELTGPMTNPRVTNEANNSSFLINGAIPGGETWVLENSGPAKRMYRKSDGANRFQYLDATSMWITLEPNNVPNNIRLTATVLSAGWDMGITWRHTYM